MSSTLDSLSELKCIGPSQVVAKSSVVGFRESWTSCFNVRITAYALTFIEELVIGYTAA
jgi:hypothetical protein